MALLSSRGISTPSLQAQGGQRRSSYFNNDRDIAGSRALEHVLKKWTGFSDQNMLQLFETKHVPVR